jgi:hypothetical protein
MSSLPKPPCDNSTLETPKGVRSKVEMSQSSIDKRISARIGTELSTDELFEFSDT